MKSNRLISKYLFLAFSSIVIFVVSGCGSSKEMISSYQNGEIKVDGDVSDWGKSIQKIPDNNFSLGFKNDDGFLYIALMTEDRSKIFQMFRAGFIVWIEPESSDYKTFGIKYPIANEQSGEPQMPELNGEGMNTEKADREGENRGEALRENMFAKMLMSQNEFEIVDKDKFPLIALPLINKDGIEAKLTLNKEQFVYELKIPLAVNKQYSFVAGAQPGSKVKLKFETLQVEQPKMDEDRGGMRMGGSEPSEGGRGGGKRRGAGMRTGGKFGSRSVPLNYTVELNLAKSESGK